MTSLPVPTSNLTHNARPKSERLKTLQEAITQGFASGEPVKLDMQAVKQKAKKQAGLIP